MERSRRVLMAAALLLVLGTAACSDSPDGSRPTGSGAPTTSSEDSGARYAQPIEFDGVGQAAAWYADDLEACFYAYDGNLLIWVRVSPVAHSHTLPPNLPERLAQVIVATMTRLAV